MKPTSKPADLYNYQVAAYLKTTSVDLSIPGPPLKNLDFSVIPKSIPKENTFLNVEPLFDIAISGSEYEYLCECKYHQDARPLTLSSVDVRDSILEFIAAEKYRMGNIKRDGIFYLLITNCATGKLNKALVELRASSDKEVDRFSETLRKRAGKKWTSFDPKIKIKARWIRNVLMRMAPVEIGVGRLREASKNVSYEKELKKMIDQVSRVSPTLVPIKYRVRNTIRFVTKEEAFKTTDVFKGGFFIEISESVVDQLLSYERIFDEHIVKAVPNETPFVKSVEILHHPNISPEDSMELVIEALNDIIEQSYGKAPFFVVINPGTYDVYYADLDWSYRVISNCINSRGFYEIGKLAEQLPIAVSKFVLVSFIKEAMRLRTGLIVRKDMMDFDACMHV